MPHEEIYAEQFLKHRLSSDGTFSALVGGRIYSWRAPQGVAFRYALFNPMGGDDTVTGNEQKRLMARLLYWARVVTKAAAGQTGLSADDRSAIHRLDDILNPVRVYTFPGLAGYSFNCWREGGMRTLTEVDERDGGDVRHSGAIYRIEVRPTP